jgi:hypothetical protein
LVAWGVLNLFGRIERLGEGWAHDFAVMLVPSRKGDSFKRV